MDPILIIVTIAACIGGLIALYFLFAGIIMIIASKKAKKFMAEEESRHAELLNRPPYGRRF